jgi:hypothetical protein
MTHTLRHISSRRLLVAATAAATLALAIAFLPHPWPASASTPSAVEHV